ncbi:Clp protease N-terminal domain-containing protein [Streptomyces sp. NPDC059894]|uniref:Clp protease N-terminal domain-containing protein n=1 Tax=unclassified Streptomyces TaxID=2593676 RepID=UPI003648D3CC
MRTSGPSSGEIPRQPGGDEAARAVDGDAGLSAELTAALAGARRRAARDGDRQIDTAHLLHSLLEHDPEVRAAFDGSPRLARLLGYLAQRSIGYGLRWQGGVEDSGALPLVSADDDSDAPAAGPVVEPVTGSVAGSANGPVGPVTRPGAGPAVGSAGEPAAAEPGAPPDLPAAEGFSPVAAAALRHARVRAAGRADGTAARGVDLLVALVADPGARAVEVLGRAGVDVRAVRAGLPDAGSPSSR